jgi:hypothetical protein
VEVRRPIQSNLRLLQVHKNTRASERSCTVSQDGAKGAIFEGDMPPKEITLKSGAVNGTVTGILLTAFQL